MSKISYSICICVAIKRHQTTFISHPKAKRSELKNTKYFHLSFNHHPTNHAFLSKAQGHFRPRQFLFLKKQKKINNYNNNQLITKKKKKRFCLLLVLLGPTKHPKSMDYEHVCGPCIRTVIWANQCTSSNTLDQNIANTFDHISHSKTNLDLDPSVKIESEIRDILVKANTSI